MDIALTGATSPFDIDFSNGDLSTEVSLETAIIISLFTDKRVSSDELPEGETSKRGWWGDAFSADGDRMGSRLWLLDRAKLDSETLAKAREYAEEALTWLIEDGLAERIEVSTSFQSGNLAIDVKTLRGGRATLSQFLLNWRGKA